MGNTAAEGFARSFLALYEGMEWFTFVGLPAAIGFLWALTPPYWPWWWKMLTYPAVLFGIAFAPNILGWLFRRRSKLFGSARFSTMLDLSRAGMLKPGGRFLGRYKGEKLFLHGEGHTLTVAAQGGGKTTSLIIPTLLSYRGGSVIVTDPKGAITAQTRRYRETVGRVVVLNPWGDELKDDPAFGLDLGDDGFNPLQAVSMTDDGQSAAVLLAALLSPDMPGEDSFWRQEGRELLEWGMLWLHAFAPPEKRNLPELRSLFYDSETLLDLFKRTAGTDLTGTGIRGLKDGARKFLGWHKAKAGGQLMGAFGTAQAALKIYKAETRLARHVSRDGFRLADLKEGEPVTLYLVCPSAHLVGDDRKWLNLVLSLICQQIGRPGRARETVLLIDEFPALKYLPNLMDALEQFREAGLRAHLIAQNVGQILTVYGEDGLRRLWGVAENKAFFRMTDGETARVVSGWLGDKTETQYRRTDARVSKNDVGVPLLRPEDLLRMPSDRQIILRPHMDPIRAEVFPYFKDRAWRSMVDPNPYRGKG